MTGKTILANVSGFTPIIDSLAAEVGLTTAAVFGVMWRYCQMRDSVCRAGLETIGAHLGIDKATAQRHATKLVAAGYIEDLTPTLRNRPHIYKDTGKAGLTVTLAAGPTAAPAVVTLQNATPTLQDATHVANSNADVANSRLSDSKKRGVKKVEETSIAPAGAGTRAIQNAYTALLGYDLTDWAAGEAKAAKSIGAKYSVDQLRAAYAHYKQDKFFKDKRVTLAYLAKQIPEFLRLAKRGPIGTKAVDQPLAPDAAGIQKVILSAEQMALKEKVAAAKRGVTNAP